MNKIALMLTASAALLVSTPGYPQQVDTATQDPDAVNREFSLQRDAMRRSDVSENRDVRLAQKRHPWVFMVNASTVSRSNTTD